MDWSKAKTILIAAFLITDLILVALLVFPAARAEAGQEPADDAVLLAVLARNNVFLETEIPQGRGEMPVLYVQPEDSDTEKMRELLGRRELDAAELEQGGFRGEDFSKKKQRTLSARDALLVFMHTENDRVDESRIIEEIKMVYWLGESEGDGAVIADTAIPAWKIVYNGGKTAHINAYEQ